MNWFPFEEDSWEDPERPRPEDEEEDVGLDATARGWAEAGNDEHDDEDEELISRHSGRWPLDARDLYPRERWLWFEQLWADACMLRERYRLGLRSGWWEDAIQVEAIAALAAWIDRYDTGEWDDPPGKLNLLYELERVGALLRDGLEPFHPARDRGPFLRHLIESGAQPPPRAEGLG
jgi:hypothetical protein